MAGTEVSPGHYYLVLERSLEDQWFLVFLDPIEVRKRRLDAFYVDEAPEGTRAPLGWSRTEETTDRLLVQLVPNENDLNRARFEIRWGSHQLEADVRVVL